MLKIKNVLLYTIILGLLSHTTTSITADRSSSLKKAIAAKSLLAGASLLTVGALYKAYSKIYGSPSIIQSYPVLSTAAGLFTAGALYSAYSKMYQNFFGTQLKVATEASLQSSILWALVTRQGDRNNMEDTHDVKINHNNAFFGLYDGHSGTRAALAAAGQEEKIQSVYDYVMANIQEQNNLEKAHEKGYIAFDKAFFTEYKGRRGGSTALTTLITSDGQEDIGTIAWAGDSRAIIVNEDGEIIYHTKDHKPDRPDERARIRKAGGTVSKLPGTDIYRVEGLSTSRALGDNDIKSAFVDIYQEDSSITAKPDSISFPIKANRIKYIILGCDGIWDVMSNEDAAKIVNETASGQNVAAGFAPHRTPEHANELWEREGNDQNLRKAAESLCHKAYDRGSKDNISAMIIKFD